jgi:uncharacterized protein (TIGR03000 family)
MRSLFLSSVLGIAALGLLASVPSQASARPYRWSGWGGWRGGWGGWRGGWGGWNRAWWAGRYYPYGGFYYPGYAGYYPPYGYYPPADYSAEASFATVDGSQSGGSGSAQAELPHRTAGPPVAPPDAGFIQLQVPDEFAEVTFDGHSVSSVGTTREYVTPPLKAGKTYHYTIKGTWGQGDQQKTVERQIDIARGQVRTVDFTAAPK